MGDYIFLFNSRAHSLFRKKTPYWIMDWLFYRFKESQEKTQTNSNDDDNKIWIFVDQDYPVISQFLAFGNICACTPVTRVFFFFFSRSCDAILRLTSRLKLKTVVICTETARDKSLTPAGKAPLSLSNLLTALNWRSRGQWRYILRRGGPSYT